MSAVSTRIERVPRLLEANCRMPLSRSPKKRTQVGNRYVHKNSKIIPGRYANASYDGNTKLTHHAVKWYEGSDQGCDSERRVEQAPRPALIRAQSLIRCRWRLRGAMLQQYSRQTGRDQHDAAETG
jgi:hypothetical protein